VRYIAECGTLNVLGDRLDKINRLFVDEAELIKHWIPDGSRLKEKLREFPAIYRNIWPEEVWFEPVPREPSAFYLPELSKRKSDEEHEDVTRASHTEVEEEAGDPGREMNKRRRVRPPPLDDKSESEGDSLFGHEPPPEERTRTGEYDDYLQYTATEERYRRLRSRHAAPEPTVESVTEDEVYTPPSSPPSGTQQVARFTPEDLPSPTPAVGSMPPTRKVDPEETAWMESSARFPFSLPSRHLPSPSPEIQADYTIPVPPAETVDADEHLRGVTRLVREGWEWTEDTFYRGTRQPPFAVRLEHALNFLREEDVDRCRDWEKKLSELEEWLDWIDYEDESRMVERCGILVRNMYRDVGRKVRAHILFEKEKYGVVKCGDGTKLREQVPLPMRGKRMRCRDMSGIEVGERVEDEGTRRVLVARPESVHTQFHPLDSIDDEESGEVDWFLRRLNDSEKAFWAAESKDVGDRDSLFRLENAAYEACSAPMGPLMKFKTNYGRGGLFLPSGEVLPPPPSGEQTEVDARLRKYAIERGARRAALQDALRCFTNTEQTLATTEWSRVVPAVEQVVLDEVRADMDRNYQWQPANLDWSTAPVTSDKLETMPYSFLWRLHRKLLADLAEHVRNGVNEKNANTRGWVTVPKGATYGGPFVWRMVDHDVQEQQDLLNECEAVLKAILSTPVQRAEGDQLPLLEGVKRYARGAAYGEFGMSGAQRFPDDVQLTLRDWDTSERLVKSVTREELKWLRILASKCVNKQMLEASNEARPKLYSIFAARLEKAMYDRREDALFLAADQWRTIEELLHVVNKGCDGSEERVRFSPFQGKFFLERAQKQGLCRCV
jgi:hypothetical protein